MNYSKNTKINMNTQNPQQKITITDTHNNHSHTETTGHTESHGHSHQEEHGHSHGGMSMLSHSHSHSHSQPNELLTASFSNPAVRITWIGLIVNIGMAISKGVGGIYFHSQSLIADAIHSVSDMIADFLTLATVNVATKVGSPNLYPLGYGKIESFGSLLVSGILLFAGLSVGWSSLLQVFEFVLPSDIFHTVSQIQFGHSHSHSDHSHSHELGDSHVESKMQIPDINAAWLAGGSIVIKEILYQQTMKVANQTNSKVLIANAWHHRVDSLTALVAVVTVTGGVMFNLAWLDSAGGILVSALIIKAGWGSFKSAIYELIDRGEKFPNEESDKYLNILKEKIPEGFKVSKLSLLTSGANSNYFITLVSKDNNDLKFLNQLENQLTEEIKNKDKFIRNVFIQFKQIPVEQFNEMTDKDINM